MLPKLGKTWSEMVIVAGGGKFGTKIAKYFTDNGFLVTIVDPAEPEVQARPGADLGGITLVSGRVEDFVPRLLKEGARGIRYLAPAAPVNVVAAIARRICLEAGMVPVPAPAMARTLASRVATEKKFWARVAEKDAICVCSNAWPGEICPENCKGSLDFCYHRGPGTRKSLFKVLKEHAGKAAKNVHEFILESVQLAPGIGAIRWADLVNLAIGLERTCKLTGEINENGGHGEVMLIAGSACNCHGVANAFMLVTARGDRKSL